GAEPVPGPPTRPAPAGGSVPALGATPPAPTAPAAPRISPLLRSITGTSLVLCERRAKPRRRTPRPKCRTTLEKWTRHHPDLTKRTNTSGQSVTIGNFAPNQPRRAVRPP